MQLTSLFERKHFARAYPTTARELDAVRDGEKALVYDAWPRDQLDNADHAELVAGALARQLAIVHRGDADEIHVYALHAAQMWRVEAHQLLLRQRWSDAAEAQQSELLGYRPEAIRAWMATQRHERLGWGQQTVFALVDDAQRAALARIGGRYLPPELVDGLALFCASGERVVRRDAHRRVGDRHVVRFAVEWAWFRGAFPTTDRPIIEVRFERRDADAINAALCERVEILGDDGWVPLQPASTRSTRRAQAGTRRVRRG